MTLVRGPGCPGSQGAGPGQARLPDSQADRVGSDERTGPPMSAPSEAALWTRSALISVMVTDVDAPPEGRAACEERGGESCPLRGSAHRCCRLLVVTGALGSGAPALGQLGVRLSSTYP